MPFRNRLPASLGNLVWQSQAFSLVFVPIKAHAQSALDVFNPGANGGVGALAVQADGKILVGGNFTLLGGGGEGTTQRNYIGRLNPDGSLDTSCNPGANGIVSALSVQPDGKILVGGNFTMLGGGGTGTTPRSRIGRLNADGTIDTSFDPGADAAVYAFAVQPRGGKSVSGNVVPACKDCNTKKKYLLPTEWDVYLASLKKEE